MMISFSHICGIDVSLPTLDIADLNNISGQYQAEYLIDNEIAQIREWLLPYDLSKTLFVLEATGTYSEKLIQVLSDFKAHFTVVAPHQSSAFFKAMGVHNKNDKQAARLLAWLGRTKPDLILYQTKKQTVQQQQQIYGALKALQKQQQMLKNQLHALAQRPFIEQVAKSAYEQTLQVVTEQIQVLEEQLTELDDEESVELKRLITTVKGIGDKTAHAVMVVTNGFNTTFQPRKLARFIGVVPSQETSGTSVKRHKGISKKGNSHLRSCLYMAARSAKKYNLACKELYERLRAKGKPYKVAMVAVMNKLIRQICAVVNSRKDFDNNYYLNFKKN